MRNHSINNLRHSVSARRRISTLIYHLLMLIVSFAMLYPVLWLVASSFKPNGDIFSTATSLIPQNFTLEHYKIGWKGFGGYSFTTFFKNSLFVAILSSIGMTLSSALVAFGLARIRFRGRSFWFVLMVVTMMLPGQVMMIPRFVLFNKMGWVGSYLPMIVPAFFASGFNIFLIMQFIRGIPRDLDEAAKIDGCSWYSVFFRIIVPMIVPVPRHGRRADLHGQLGGLYGRAALPEQALLLHRRLRAEDVQRQLHVRLRRDLRHVRRVSGTDPDAVFLLPEEPCRGHLHSGPEGLILQQGDYFYA